MEPVTVRRQMYGVGAIPWSPLGRGVLTRPLSVQTKRSETDACVPLPLSPPSLLPLSLSPLPLSLCPLSLLFSLLSLSSTHLIKQR